MRQALVVLTALAGNDEIKIALVAEGGIELVLSAMTHHQVGCFYLYCSHRDVKIPCPTCPTWSKYIQDKLKISIYSSWDKYL